MKTTNKIRPMNLDYEAIAGSVAQPDRPPAPAERIAVARFSALGDIVLASSALAAVRETWPRARIDFIVARGFEALLEKCPYIDRVLVYDREPGLRGFPALFQFAARLRKEKYNLFIDLHDNRRSRLLASLVRPLERSRSLGRRRDDYPQILRYPLYLRSVGAPTRNLTVPFWAAEREKEFLTGFFARNGLDGKTLVGMGVVGSWPSKRWPPEYFADLGERLIDRYGAIVLLFGGPGDKPEADRIARLLNDRCLNLCGETAISQSAALASVCHVTIANDSGLMHMAACGGAPTIGLFGPTGARLSAPVGPKSRALTVQVDCSPCHKPVCPLSVGVMECMKALTPEMVFEAVREILGPGNNTAEPEPKSGMD